MIFVFPPALRRGPRLLLRFVARDALNSSGRLGVNAPRRRQLEARFGREARHDCTKEPFERRVRSAAARVVILQRVRR